MADSLQVASSGSAVVGYCKAVSMGKVPASPKLKHLRRVSFDVNPAAETFTSAEISARRGTRASNQGGRSAPGTINTELSAGSHADLMAAAMGDYWQTPVPVDCSVINLTATLVSEKVEITASSFDFVAAQLFVNAPVTFVGTGNAAFDGKLFTVSSHASNKVILIPPAGFTLESPASLTTGTFGIKGARAGLNQIKQDFVFERAFTDIGSFIVYVGEFINTMQVAVPTNGVATCAYGLLGIDALTLSDASIDGVAEIELDATDFTSLTFDADAGTITRGSGSWIADGIEAGNRIQIDGAGITDVQNRNPRTVIEVTSATVIKVAEAIQTGGPYTGTITVTRVGLPDYTAAPDERVMVSAAGLFLRNGEPIGTLTEFGFEHNNNMGGAAPVGAQTMAAVFFGNQASTTGNLTAYFDRGGHGEAFYNAFRNNTDNVQIGARLDNDDGTGCITFAFGRANITSGSIADGQENGTPVACGFTAVEPDADHPEVGTSQIYIYDTTVTGVEPPTAALTLTKVSETGGVATLKVEGGVAPYSFVFDTSETPIVVPVAGEFTHDYVSNATYASTISDASTPTKSANLSVVITSA